MKAKTLVPVALLGLLAALAAVLVPASALAAEKSNEFAATLELDLVQPALPEPILHPIFGFPIGVHYEGEVFAGEVDECDGAECKHLEDRPVVVTQNASLFFLGPPDPLTGVILFAGTIDGSFDIGGKGGNLSGAYAGGLFGSISPIPGDPLHGLIMGMDAGTWDVDGGTGRFKRAEGAGALAGEFEGLMNLVLSMVVNEHATVALTGTLDRKGGS